MAITIEVCSGSYHDCLMAYKGGAKRVELNSALSLGGLTPSLADLKLTKKHTDLNVVCMVRPRGAGFTYTEDEVEVMFESCKDLLEANADGIAFGFLTNDHKVDVEKTKKMVELIHSYGRTAVFHRAFDCCNDGYEAIETLIALGVDRILTSGMMEKAMQGMDFIKDIQKRYGDQIEILVGSGMNDTNVEEMVQTTNVKQVHSSCKGYLHDQTTFGKHVNYSYNGDDSYEVVLEEKVRKLVERVGNL